MTKNKKLYCSLCYDGKIVKDELTEVLFCNNCFEEYEVPVFKK